MDSRDNGFNSTNNIVNNNFNNNIINYIKKEDNDGSNAASSVAGMTSMSDAATGSVGTKASGYVTSVPSVHLQGLTPTNASITNSNLNLTTNTNNNNTPLIDKTTTTTTTGTTLLPIPPPPHKLVYSSGPSQAPLPSVTGGGMNTKHHLSYLLRKESDHVLPITAVNPVIHNSINTNMNVSNSNSSSTIINTLHAGEAVVIKHPHGLVPSAL